MSDVPGVQQRLLIDSFRHLITWTLDGLGWFSIDAAWKPIEVLVAPHKWDIPVDPNLVALHFDNTETEQAEVGNTALLADVNDVTITLYAETESLGINLSADLVDILRGNFPSLGRVRSTFPILDFQQPTPPVIGYASIGSISTNRIPTRAQAYWQSRLFELSFQVTRHTNGDS
jgi:hypothetical protein